jgi:toxin ParE1/3/4
VSYRLLGGAEDDIDRILLQSARRWGIDAARRYDLLIRAVFNVVGDDPALPGHQAVAKVAGVRVYPFRLGRRLVDPEQRVGQPRHVVVYRVAADGVVEIVGIAHDRMLLARAARRMQRKATGCPD